MSTPWNAGELGKPDPAGQAAVPELAPLPRPVPAAVQWQLLRYGMAIVVGGGFVLASLVFIVPHVAAGNRFETPFQALPFLHLTVGLGLVIVPLVVWRRTVAVLRYGVLAPARITAFQDQGSTGPPGVVAHGVRNLTGPWVDYGTALVRARLFWARRLAAGGSEERASVALGFAGIVAATLGFFTTIVVAFGVTAVWLGNDPVAKKAMLTLFLIGFLTAYLAAVWFGWRWIAKLVRFACGRVSFGGMGIKPIARCRFTFLGPGGHELTGEAYIDLRPRLLGELMAADLVVYLPDEPRRALLLGGLWPPLAVENGEWVQRREPGAEAG